jgi:hypothetical protein
MAQDLRVRYEVADSLGNRDVLDALAEIGEDDISKKSPVTAGAPEVSTGFYDTDDGRELVIAVSGPSGDWSKTSEQAVTGAVESLDGVGDRVYSSGGYESDDEDDGE